MLEVDDDSNANYLSEEKELIKEHLLRIEEINEKIREICIKASKILKNVVLTNSIKFHQAITQRLSDLSKTLSTNENAPSSKDRHNLSKEEYFYVNSCHIRCNMASENKLQNFVMLVSQYLLYLYMSSCIFCLFY